MFLFFLILTLHFINSFRQPDLYSGTFDIKKRVGDTGFSVGISVAIDIGDEDTQLYAESKIKTTATTEELSGVEGDFAVSIMLNLPKKISDAIIENHKTKKMGENYDIPSFPQNLGGKVGITITFLDFIVNAEKIEIKSKVTVYPLEKMYLRFSFESQTINLKRVQKDDHILIDYNIKRKIGPILQL